MTETNPAPGSDDAPEPVTAAPPAPTWRERTRPVELLAIAGILAIFTFLVSWMSTRDIVLSLIFGGVSFIVGLVVLAMLALAVAPDGQERAEIDEPGESPDGPAH